MALLSNAAPVDPHPVNWTTAPEIAMKIRHEGVMDLAEVERVMGGPGTPIPIPYGPPRKGYVQFFQVGERYYRMEDTLRGPVRLARRPAKDNNNAVLWIADAPGPGETGEVPKWYRWGDDDRYTIVGVVEGKAFCSKTKGLPSRGSL